MNTQRTEYDRKTWWENIFNIKLSNVSEYKWNCIKSKFEECTLQEFRGWFAADEFPPIELAHYYRDLDLYEIGEGHHRTSWAIFTGAPFIKVEKLYIWERRSDLLENYKIIMKKKKLLKRIAQKMNLSVSSVNTPLWWKGYLLCEERIHFKDYLLFNVPTIDINVLKNENYRIMVTKHLDECIQFLYELKNENHSKFRLLKWIKKYILLTKFRSSTGLKYKHLISLYSKGWSLE